MAINPFKYIQLLFRRYRMTREETIGERWAAFYLDKLNIPYKQQVILYPYIVDFVLPNNIILEIDGDTHAHTDRYDDTRSYWLHKRGYDIYRLDNRDVTLENIQYVCKEYI